MPNQVSNVGFASPGFDFGADINEVERRRKLAEALQAQSMQPLENQTAGGWAIPTNPLQGAAKLAQALSARSLNKQANEEQRAIAQRSQDSYAQMLAKGIGQLQGGPGSPSPAPELGGGPAQPAQAPDPMGAMGTFGSHPMGAQMMPLAMQQMQREQLIRALRGGGGAPGDGAAPAASGAAPSGTGASSGGPAGGLPLEVWLQVDPTGKAYAEQLAKDHAPIVGREGAPVLERGPDGKLRPSFVAPKSEPGVTYQYGPNGEVMGANAVPGYAGAISGIEGAKADVTAQRDMVTVNTPQGPRMVTRAQAIQMAGGGVGGAQQPPAPQPIAAPRAAGPGIPLQDQGAQRAETEIGAGLGKRYTEIQDAGFSANQKINKVSRLGGLLENLNTGKLQPAGYEIAAYAKSIGIPVSEKLDNAQAAKAVANEVALELRNPSGGAGMPGAMSDADREYLRSMIAGLDKTPGANKALIDGAQKIAERDRDVAKLAREYKRENGKFDEGFFDRLDRFSKENPLFKGSPAPTPAKTLSASEKQELDALRARFGRR